MMQAANRLRPSYRRAGEFIMSLKHEYRRKEIVLEFEFPDQFRKPPELGSRSGMRRFSSLKEALAWAKLCREAGANVFIGLNKWEWATDLRVNMRNTTAVSHLTGWHGIGPGVVDETFRTGLPANIPAPTTLITAAGVNVALWKYQRTMRADYSRCETSEEFTAVRIKTENPQWALREAFTPALSFKGCSDPVPLPGTVSYPSRHDWRNGVAPQLVTIIRDTPKRLALKDFPSDFPNWNQIQMEKRRRVQAEMDGGLQ